MNRLALVGMVGAALALTFLLGFSYGMKAPARYNDLHWDGSYPPARTEGKIPV